MAKRPLTPTVVPATLVVAAANSLHPERADYRCTGVNDHLVIQAALDALPATGGEVKLLDGTYNVEVSLALDSYQTLRGCGRNTILTTTTANLDIITAIGGAGTEKVGILIADLCVDGPLTNDIGIYFNYVDYSKISTVWSLHNGEAGIQLNNSDFNTVIGNTCQEANRWGIYLYSSNNNTITGNTCQGNDDDGIWLSYSNNNTVTGNTCQGNGFDGIYLHSSNNNTVTGNTCQGNGHDGIYLYSSNNNTVTGNICFENSQITDNSYDNIYLKSSDYNLIADKTCRRGALANKPQYGINISNAACDHNMIHGNNLYDSGSTGDLNDAGTNTHKRDNLSNVGAWLADV